MATFEELTQPLTRQEIEAAIYSAIEARGAKTSAWKPGAIARTIIAGVAIILAAFSVLQQRIAQSGFLELAAGDWLTIVAREVYGVERNAGTFATGVCTLDNAGGGVFAPNAGDVIVFNSATGKTYRNTAAFTLAAFETGKAVIFEAVEIGADSTSAAGDVDSFETVLLGVAVTNALPLVGRDPETDADLRDRCLAKTGTLSPNGAADAYRFVALSAETTTGAPAGVTRVTTIPDGAGTVTVLVCDGTGTLTGTIGDAATALGAVDLAIQSQVVPLGVTANVSPSTPEIIAVTYEVWVRSQIGITPAELQSQISAALVAYIAEIRIGGAPKTTGGAGFVWTDAIRSVIGEVVGRANLIDLDLTLPAADVPISSTKAPVSGTITATAVHLVA